MNPQAVDDTYLDATLTGFNGCNSVLYSINISTLRVFGNCLIIN